VTELDQAERTALAIGILWPDTIAAIAEAMPSADLWASPLHASIAEALQALAFDGRHVNALTVAQHLGQASNANAAQYVPSLLSQHVSPDSLQTALTIAVTEANRRHLSAVLQRAMMVIGDPEHDPADTAATLAEAARMVSERGVADYAPHIGDHIPKMLEYLKDMQEGNARAVGYTTGIAALDRIARLRPEEMSIVAARPSMGKTAMMCTMALAQAKAGIPVCIFSCEMGAKSLVYRTVAAHSGVDMQAPSQITPGGWQAMGDAMTRMKGMPIWLDDRPGARADEIVNVARRMVQRHGIKVFYVDYLQFVRPPRYVSRGANREEQTAAISSTFKQASKTLDAHWCILAQLNRDADGKEPRLAHLRESGAIEQDADVVAMLHRANLQASEAKIIVAKQRNGPTGDCQAEYFPRRCLFADASGRVSEDVVDAVTRQYVDF
jgi:replicative DNA helicase